MKKLARLASGAAALVLVAAGTSCGQQSPQPQNQAQEPQAQQAEKQPEPQLPHEQRSQQSANESQRGSQSTTENPSEGEIRQIQQLLEQKGFKVGYIDGKLGPITRRALSQFQRKQGLQQTGMPDQQTLAALGIAGGASTTGEGPSRNGGINPSQAPKAKQMPIDRRQPTAADAPSQDPCDLQLRHDLNLGRGC